MKVEVKFTADGYHEWQHLLDRVDQQMQPVMVVSKSRWAYLTSTRCPRFYVKCLNRYVRVTRWETE